MKPPSLRHGKAGPDPVGSGVGTSPSNHIVQFYERDDAMCEAVAEFLAGGLDVGEPVVIIATDTHRPSLFRHLEVRDVDIPRCQADGLVTLLDARHVLDATLVGDAPDRERFDGVVGAAVRDCVRRHGGARVRAFGEMVDLLWRDGRSEVALAMEHLWDDLLRAHGVSLLCTYRLGNFAKEAHGDAFHRICRAHTHVIPAESFTETGDGGNRLLAIARLQQRARALETEVVHRREVEEELRRTLDALRRAQDGERLARRDAEAANRAKDEFLAMLGHELRNPLSPIVTALELLKIQGDGAAAHAQGVIERQVRHMAHLIDDLLDVSRVTGGKLELRRSPVDMAEVVARAIEMASPLLEQQRHHLAVSVGDDLVVLGDANRLAQVVSNLLTNAAKYTAPGGQVSLVVAREGDQIVLQVADTGIGIPKETLPAVFDLFVQEPQALDRAQGGLGLGLAIVRSLVELHGGSVTAHSGGRGCGSQFVVRLPATEQRPGDRPDVEPDAPPPAPSTERLRILVVDDNEDAADLLAEGLRTLGHAPAVAHDGPGAILLAHDFVPDVALLDIGLPAMDGYELARYLRGQRGWEGVTFVAITGYGQETDRQRSRQAGFDAHLVKPVDLSTLHPLILELRKRRAG